MRKYVVAVALAMLFSVAFADSSKRVVIMPVTGKNIADSESYVLDLVRDKLEANFRTYTPFTVVDIANEHEIRALQAKSEGDAFDADTSIELQRLTSANNAIFSTVIRTRRGFILSVSLTDLATGVKKAAVSPITKEYGEDLFDGQNCAVDSATIQVCKQMGIALTSEQMAALSGGSAPVSSNTKDVASAQKQSPQNIIPQNEDDCVKAGYKMFVFDKSAEDNLVFPNKTQKTYEVDIYAVHRKRGFKHFGLITVRPKKGYKGNPLDKDLDQYSSIYMKVTNDQSVTIMNMGERSDDQYFSIE